MLLLSMGVVFAILTLIVGLFLSGETSSLSLVTLILSAGIYALGILLACVTAWFYRRRRCAVSPTHLMIVGTFFGLVFYFFPLAYLDHGASASFSDLFPAVIASVIRAMGTFAGEGDYTGAAAALAALNAEWTALYRIIGVALHFSAPFLTLGFILSFVKNLSAWVRYRLAFWRPAHIFSELNEESVALARSIVRDDSRNRLFRFLAPAVIVFTDVVDRREEEDYDLVSEAEKMGAILFHKDLESIRFRWRHLHAFRRLSFYLLHNSETERVKGEGEKLRHAAHIVREYDRRGVSLYLFSSSKESELFLSARGVPKGEKALCSLMPKKLRVTRIDAVQSLIYHNLDRYGLRLFKNARCLNNDTIHSVIVGLGQYGQEMLRALTWYAQVVGFRLVIDAFDESPEIRDRLRLAYPEMIERGEAQAAGMPPEDGEANYSITIHSGVDVRGDRFFDTLMALSGVTHVFVSLGSDENNIAMSSAIRARFNSRADHLPDIETVVYDSDLAERMGMTYDAEGIASLPEDAEADGALMKKCPYRIHMFGDLDSFYSLDTLINSELSDAGYLVHMRYNAYFREEPDNDAIRTLDEIATLCKRDAERRQARAEGRELALQERVPTRRERRELRKKLGAIKAQYGAAYYDNEYNYRSTIGKCIAERLREKLVDLGYITLPDIHIPWGERSEEARYAIGRMEHPRWNAYMRAQGYTLGPRDDLAKHHPNLVNLSELSDEDIRKDA